MNLTAITDPSAMVVEHLLDSMAIAPWVQGGRVLDIGSGAGFPGIPLAVVLPQVAFTLLDSRGKRIEFLQHAVSTLGLANVTVGKARVEDYRPGKKFDTLVCRALAPLEKILTLTTHLHSPGTCLLAMKGPLAGDEIAVLPARWRQAVQVESVQVPFLDAKRHIIRLPFADRWPSSDHS